MINSLLHNESHLQHLILITVRELYPKLDQPDEWDPTKLALVSLQSLTYEELDNMNTITVTYTQRFDCDNKSIHSLVAR